MRATVPVSSVAARPQLAGRRGGHLPVGGRDRVAVRVALREPQLGVDAGHQPIRHRVLEHLGLVVHLVPAVAELVDQEGLQQPVPAHHRQRRSPARLGQGHRAVLLVVDQALLGEFADRLRGRAGRHPDPVGQHLGADLFHRPLLGIPDDLEIVLANRGETASALRQPSQPESLGNPRLIWRADRLTRRRSAEIPTPVRRNRDPSARRATGRRRLAVVQRWRGQDEIPTDWGRCVLTIGVFDGVHRGHAELIAHAVKAGRARNVPAVLMTFDPHPMEVVYPGSHPAQLTTLTRRAELVEELGIDVFLVMPFTTRLHEAHAGALCPRAAGGAPARGGGRGGGELHLRQEGGSAPSTPCARPASGSGSRWSRCRCCPSTTATRP